ncbi:glycosyltransferase family 2 protein [Paenibacillus sp. PL2-23]|uniref:glycosyltransferase n=1 Tax=Paenibacillus sp. PL2-23 TaxID=2100729 RepID=UPI0030FA4317
MVFFFWLIACMLAAQLLFVLWNLSQLPKLGRWNTSTGSAKLSVLIPARNEEERIGACLQSVSEEPLDDMEVLVLDDRSTDGTAELVRRAAEADSRMKLVQGQELPPGWTGKSYACHQLAEAASGDWLLFLDADARLAPGAVASAMAGAARQGKGMITGFPLQRTATWLEKLVVPMMMFTIACHLPIRLVRHSRDARFAAAHGAFVLVHRDSYRKAGGHAANRGHLVDDVQLAKAMKEAGEPLTLADVRGLVSMRMYGNAREVWNGYKKNMFAGLGRSRALLLTVVAAYSAMYLVPPAAALAGGLSLLAGGTDIGVWLLPAIVCWLLGMAVKAVVDVKNGQPIWLSALLPASIAALCAIAIASWWSAGRQGGYEWKGRTYS